MAALFNTTMATEEIEEKSTTPAFWAAFNARVQEFRTTLKTLVVGNADDLIRIHTLKTQLSELQVFATEATPLLAAYDVRRSQEEIEAVGKELRDVESALIPKKKFSFTRNTTTSKPAVVAASTSVSSSSSKQNTESKATDDVTGSYIISSQTGTTLLLSPTELHAVSRDGVPVQLLIKDCSSVTISAPTMLGSVRLEDLYDCIIFLGPCCTSVYLEDCRDCTVVLACHQLRIHKTHNCSLYVRVNTHPIIEDCTEMGFAQYSAVYDGIVADIETADLTDAKCWNNVVDFRWHRTTKSPHWHVLPPEKALPVVPSVWGDHSGWRSVMSTQGQGLGQGQDKLGQGNLRPTEGPATIVEGSELGSELGKTTTVAVEEEDEL